MRCLPEDRAELADEVRRRHMGHRGDGADIERLGIGPIHRVPGAQEAPVQILDVPAHGATLRHQGRVGPTQHRDHPGGPVPVGASLCSGGYLRDGSIVRPML